MRITLLEPFFGGSHRQWAEGLAGHSKHEVEIYSLPGRFWKWRMYGAAVTLAEEFLTKKIHTDLLLASDMLDLATFLALTRKRGGHIPTALYFHENQITYPWSPTDQDTRLGRNNQYGFINYTSALAADRIFFNSDYHRQSFLNALPGFLKQFPDFQMTHLIDRIQAKSEVLPLGIDFKKLDTYQVKKEAGGIPIILWNHRWEYDKNPAAFFTALFRLKEEGIKFQLLVLGESYKKSPAIFEEGKQRLQEEILHWGYLEDASQYYKYLWLADILPVTSQQDFFGISTVEAMYCETYPILPRRLAFPEHVPDAEKSKYFYNTEDELYLLLKNAVLKNDITREKAAKAKTFVQGYDWMQQIKNYDQIFEDVINNGKLQ